MSQKSYDGTATLYLIATPIGNMEDITYRALETLKKVEVVFSEDTRITNQLLQHFDIKKKLINLIAKSNEDGEEFIDLLMIAKYLERIGDHATNIAEWVEYSILGKHEPTEE